MEPAKSPLKGRKMPRPSYKTLWQEKCADVEKLTTLLNGETVRADEIAEAYDRAIEDGLATSDSLFRWASAAIIEALPLVIVIILLLAR